MSKLLFDEQPIVVSKELAKLIGLNEAIVLQQVHYWLEINRKAEKNFHEGRYWTYNSIRAWHEENFEFWHYDTVKRTFAKLEDTGLLISANFNKDPRDKTKWYSINENALEALKNAISAKCTNERKHAKTLKFPIGAKCTNALEQNAPMQKGKMHQPLPEISTEITTDIKNQSINQEKEIDRSIEKTFKISISKKEQSGQAKHEKMPFPESEEKAFTETPIKTYHEYKDIIAKNIAYYQIKNKYGEKIDEILELMTDVMISNKKTIRVDGEDKPIELVKSVFMKLDQFHIEYVIECLGNTTTKANNMKSYLLTTLYNANKTKNAYYSNLVNHDMAHGWGDQERGNK